MQKTKIEWCDSSFNPVTGCYHECPYCYARKTATRFKGCDASPDGVAEESIITLNERLKVKDKSGNIRNAAYPYGFVPTFHKYRLNDIQTKGYGETIFVCSMADLFGEWVPDEWIEQVFDACKEAPNHRYLFLTKNPKRYIQLAEDGKLPKLDNFWYGTTAETPDSPIFWGEGYHNFVSVEPILAPFYDTEGDILGQIEWVIFGAETGKRPDKVVPERSWIEETVESLQNAGIPVFMKDSMKDVWGDDIITQFPWDDLK